MLQLLWSFLQYIWPTAAMENRARSGESSRPTHSPPPLPPNTEFLHEGYDLVARKHHEGFMREAIAMAELALATDETPVGCVIVHDNKVIARGMNATNRTLNGTRHAEFMAIGTILSPPPTADSIPKDAPEICPTDILTESILYVTVEPCVMCASLLRQYGIKKVYYGAANERFGGTGGVLNIHSDPSVDRPYPCSGGWLREEAIMLLRKFYVQQNDKAPAPRNKKERVLKTNILPMGVRSANRPAIDDTRSKSEIDVKAVAKDLLREETKRENIPPGQN